MNHQTSLKTRIASIAILCFGAAGSAVAQHAEKCEPIPKAEWRPKAELEKQLTDRGWKVSRVKKTNGCYEVYGKNETGRNVEAFFHPKTFAAVTVPK